MLAITPCIISGSRTLRRIDRSIVESAIKRHRDQPNPKNLYLIYGCADGVDSFVASSHMRECWFAMKKFQANWKKYSKGAGDIRNKAMIDFAIELAWEDGYSSPILLAFPDANHSPGTLNCIHQAKVAEIETEVYKIGSR